MPPINLSNFIFTKFPSPSIMSRLMQQRLLTTPSMQWLLRPKCQTHVIFGANTDVGKSVVSAGLIRASGEGTNYIKPLQCGGSDQRFVEKHASNVASARTLFEWETPASPHFAARIENKPVSDEEVIKSLTDYLEKLDGSLTWIETAGGVMSPSSSSPDNNQPHHAKDTELSWGWVPQADLYRPLIESSSAVLVGDGRLGGISATLTALEALLIRGYKVDGIILVENGYENKEAVQEYISRGLLEIESSSSIFRNPDASIISLPGLPPEPEPLTEWYEMTEVGQILQTFVHEHLVEEYRKTNTKV